MITITDPASYRAAVQEWAIAKGLLLPGGAPANGMTLMGQVAKLEEEIWELEQAWVSGGWSDHSMLELADVGVCLMMVALVADVDPWEDPPGFVRFNHDEERSIWDGNPTLGLIRAIKLLPSQCLIHQKLTRLAVYEGINFCHLVAAMNGTPLWDCLNHKLPILWSRCGRIEGGQFVKEKTE